MRHAREDYDDRIIDTAGIIPPDEPVFLIRAQDLCGPHAVEAWANMAEQLGASPAMVQKARDHAGLMRRWRHRKVPDMYEDQKEKE